MAFYGLALYGPEKFLDNCLRKEYREPKNIREVEPLMKKVVELSTCPVNIQRPRSDIVRQIDIYLGMVNGFAYGSLQRLNKMKLKRILKPVGPNDIYRKPPTRQSEYGWFLCDRELEGATWHRTDYRVPLKASPNTKLLDIVKRSNKYATLF